MHLDSKVQPESLSSLIQGESFTNKSSIFPNFNGLIIILISTTNKYNNFHWWFIKSQIYNYHYLMFTSMNTTVMVYWETNL